MRQGLQLLIYIELSKQFYSYSVVCDNFIRLFVTISFGSTNTPGTIVPIYIQWELPSNEGESCSKFQQKICNFSSQRKADSVM